MSKLQVIMDESNCENVKINHTEGDSKGEPLILQF